MMNIEQKNENGKITFILDGWLDHESAPVLGAEIEGIGSADEIVLDLDKVEYISSAGIRMLVTAHRKAKELDAEFVIIHVNPEVKNILLMTGLNKKLDIRE